MSVDHHSDQPSDITMADANTITAHPEDYRDQSATTEENRGESIMTEILDLTAQFAKLSTTSANLTRCILEPPKAHDRVCRKRTCRKPHHHYLYGLQPLPTELCPRHAAVVVAIRRYFRSVSENRQHASASLDSMLQGMTAPGCSKRCSRARKGLLGCPQDDVPTIAEDAISPQHGSSPMNIDIRNSSSTMQK
ncbi:uncharacterized protein FMAN_11777 [Fusarium mangiferae]|uniref:Uncharacterized protein n=1 Tax=Fusarium mangiferae TaxID=192010 RepID=A0A1L7UGI8_FUSMA|nr:uncharacterized protein FMAN_11777 [Fusarium mangiferae]CVL06621.1 uncharacterized protein FMAN_11777 [Fusarium mangiferae]